jgi:hypothetical protein
MKQINNHTANAMGKIHGTTISVFLIANMFVGSFLNGELFPQLLEWLSPTWLTLLGAVIDATLYSGIYCLVKLLFDRALVKKNKKLDVAGRWYHVHIPRFLGEIDYNAVRLSAGYTDVSRELYDFTFDGHNKHFKYINGEVVSINDYSTHWFTKAVKYADLNEFDLIEIYEADSKGKSVKAMESCPCCKTQFPAPVQISDSENFRYGIHTFKLLDQNKDGKCDKIEADFADCWPSLKNGDLHFFRTEKERDEFIKEYFITAEIRKAELLAEKTSTPCLTNAS